MAQYDQPQSADYTKYIPMENGSLPYTSNGHTIDPHLGGVHGGDDDDGSADPMIQHLTGMVVDSVEAQDAATHAATQAAMAAAQQARHKQTRVAQACDACSQRKVRCDTNQPCGNCTDLGVECTRNRERRRRGPPNRVKERIDGEKRMRSDGDLDVSTAIQGLNSSRNFGMAQSSIELIAPPEMISVLISDFYAHIYPIHPFPHETWVLQSFNRRADMGNHGYNPFLALIASMVGLVATLRSEQTQQQVKHLGYGDIDAFKIRCRSICITARGVGYQDRVDLDANDAATSYFLALMNARDKQWSQYRSSLSDAVGIIHNQLLFATPEKRADEIKRQTAFRVFWATFVLSRSIEHQQPLGSSGVFFPRFPIEPYTKYPAPVDDASISADGLLEDQPSLTICPPTLCLNSLIHLYTAGDVPLAASSNADFIDTGNLPNVRASIFAAPAAVRNAFETVDGVVRDLVNHRGEVDEVGSGAALEIQRTNIMLSSILMRNYLINRAVGQVIDNNLDMSDDERHTIAAERECLTKGVLFLARDLTSAGLEPDFATSHGLIRRVVEDLCCDQKTLDTDAGCELEKLGRALDVSELGEDLSGLLEYAGGKLREWQVDFAQSKATEEIQSFL